MKISRSKILKVGEIVREDGIAKAISWKFEDGNILSHAMDESDTLMGYTADQLEVISEYDQCLKKPDFVFNATISGIPAKVNAFIAVVIISLSFALITSHSKPTT